ncbi:hypothetical protein ACFQE8_15780 [Salinirubellus sp. GCM10025818]|uniref:hypothetical protein n=1 Tax=Salinirubellus TaxID=2162630 RepID=UPI0030D252AB
MLGAALADVADTEREYAARVGRGLSTARQIHRVLDADPGLVRVTPHAVDGLELREYAARRWDGADRALDRLAETADVTPLRSLAETNRSSTSHRREERSRE